MSFSLSDLFASISLLEIYAVVFATAYLILVIRQNALCWPAALVSVLLSFLLFLEVRLYMQAVLQLFYAAMAVYGWYRWRYGGSEGQGVAIRLWALKSHLIAIGLIVVSTVLLGAALMNTDAALPYVDSFTSVAAVVATLMVANKILENWIYWFVIDTVLVFLYAARELPLYAVLYMFYLLLVIVGLRRWMRDLHAQQLHAENLLG